MGADFSINPPKEQCSRCQRWFEQLNEHRECVRCEIRRLRARVMELESAEQRLRMAMKALVDYCGFTEAEVGEDVAPRIIEWAAKMEAVPGGLNDS